MAESTPRRESFHSGSPKRLDGDIFHFKDNKVTSFSSSDGLLSSPTEKDHLKDTIMDDNLVSESESDDEDYTLQLSTDSDEDEEDTEIDDNDSETRLFNFNKHPLKNNSDTTSFIFEYEEDDFGDFDHSQYQFEPIEQRSEFFKLSFNFLPYGILIFFTLLLFYNVAHLVTFDSIPRDTEKSLINHKILALNDQVNDLMHVKVELDSLKTQLSSVLSSNSNQHTQIVNEVQIQKILNKLQSLEKRIDIDTRVKAVEFSTAKAKSQTTTQIAVKRKLPSVPPSSFNIANQCNVDPNLTTLPKRERLRKTISQRILYGYVDLIRRIRSKLLKSDTHQNWWDVISGGHSQSISLNSNDVNSPLNALKEESDKLWLNKVSDLPVYLSLKFNDPVKIREVGIHQTRIHSRVNANVRQVSLFVQPANDIKLLKSHLRKNVNQELNFNKLNKQLKSWVRLSEMEYNIHDEQSYQKFHFDPNWISDWEIQKVMIIIHSNWGDEETVILDSLRIFQGSETIKSIPVEATAKLLNNDPDDVPFL